MLGFDVAIIFRSVTMGTASVVHLASCQAQEFSHHHRGAVRTPDDAGGNVCDGPVPSHATRSYVLMRSDWPTLCSIAIDDGRG